MNWIEELYKLEVEYNLLKLNGNKKTKYCQDSEEAYIKHILKNIPEKHNFIVDIGADDGFHLSNSRYFIEKGYNSILIDERIQDNKDIKQHKIIKENVLSLLKTYGCPNNFDFLTIDIDGNDYWVIDELLSEFSPNLIIAEFNCFLAQNKCVTVAYNSNLSWTGDTYFGFTLDAGKKLAKKHGYTVIFQNNNMNLYMVKTSFCKIWKYQM